MLGPWHGFKIANKKASLPGDVPGEEKCIYAYENKLKLSDKETELWFQDDKLCNKKLIYTVTKDVHIPKNGAIVLDVSRTGEGQRSYQCRWVKSDELGEIEGTDESPDNAADDASGTTTGDGAEKN